MFSDLSLKYRIAIIIFCLEAIMMTAVLQQTLGQSFEASRSQIFNNQHAILELVSGMSKSALITEEYAELQPYIVNLVAETEATSLLLADANKTIVISNTSTDIGQQLPELKQRKDHRWQTAEIINASGLMGTLAIEFSNKALTSAYVNARDFGIGIALTGMIIIAFIGLLVGFLLTRRLDDITETAQRLANGDFSARTQIKGKDEIGKLASTFNEMVQGLLQSKDELKKTLKILKEKEQHLAITLHSIGDAVITTDSKGNVTRMNSVAENLTGWTFEQAQGLSLKIIFPIVNASTREPIENPVDKVIATGETIYLSNHTTLISKNGTEYQIADSAAPIRDKGEILGMVLVFNDVTEQYKLREAAYKSRRDLQSIMDNSPAIIYVRDSEGKFSFVNNQFVELYQINHEEIIGQTLCSVFSKELCEQMAAHDKDIFKLGKTLETEQSVVHAEGLRIYSSIKFPLRDGDNNIYAICDISTDITDKKAKDEQLRRSQKMDALGKLTGGIAHDYNNMLGVILGYSDIIEETVKEQPKLAKYIYEIKHAAERGATLTKKLLTFSRQHSSASSVVNINSLLQNSQLMLEKTMTVRISLILKLQKNIFMVNVDANELEDAILNMSINAMHAIDGNGQVTFETRNETISSIDAQQLQISAGEYVLLSITDTGCGMDNDIKDKIFDPFYSTKGEFGTGLGLSQVYGLVQRSKGNIKIYSELGHGSRFTLYFPRFYQSEIEEQAFKEVEITDLSGNQAILVVDDEPALANVTSQILAQQGYQVFRANSGADALKILEQQSIDVLLSDVIMPEMDGYQLAAIVSEKYPKIKIQLSSGFSDTRHIDNINIKLQKNLLDKPYHSKRLLVRIRELINNSI